MAIEHHEPREVLPQIVLDQHRAIASLNEEMEAVIWYHERAAASQDPEIKAVMEHNRDEEIEHACMILEWLRRNFPGFDQEMRTYLFKDAPITQLEEMEEAQESESQGNPGPQSGSQSLNIGSLRKG